MSKYQVILSNKNDKNYYYSYIESSDSSLGNISIDDLPPYADVNKARSCYLDGKNWIYDESKYNSIKEEQNQIAINNLIDVNANEKLQLLAESIVVEAAPSENGIILPEKLGYIWKKECIFVNGTPHIRWILIEDVNYVPVNDGSDYLKAINWTVGDSVIEGLWYNVGDDYIWQAIKTGVPSSAEDKTYFDIP